MAIQKEKIIQSITAYRCRICKKYHNEDLLVKSEGNEVPLDIESILWPFFDYMKKCKIDKYTSRAILLAHEAERKELEGSVVRLHICPDAGKALENFSVVNHRKNTVQGYRGDNHSAVYAHNVLIYLKENSNVFIFHHYGQSGCKTAFLNTLNDFLGPQGLMAHLDVLMSNEMFNGNSRYIPEKISLITTYSDISTDKADNIGDDKPMPSNTY